MVSTVGIVMIVTVVIGVCPIVAIVVWTRVIIRGIPSTVPTGVVTEVPTAPPAAVVETEAWGHVPPGVEGAIIPKERIIVGYIIPR
jgi:hypothetical protein